MTLQANIVLDFEVNEGKTTLQANILLDFEVNEALKLYKLNRLLLDFDLHHVPTLKID